MLRMLASRLRRITPDFIACWATSWRTSFGAEKGSAGC
jgi:hypothetical protein